MARLKHKGQKIKSNKDVKFIHMHSDGSGGWNWREEADQESGQVQGIYATLHEANAACKAQVRDDHNIDDHDEEECDSEDEDEAIYGSDLEVEEFEYPSGKLRVRISQYRSDTLDWVEELVDQTTADRQGRPMKVRKFQKPKFRVGAGTLDYAPSSTNPWALWRAALNMSISTLKASNIT